MTWQYRCRMALRDDYATSTGSGTQIQRWAASPVGCAGARPLRVPVTPYTQCLKLMTGWRLAAVPLQLMLAWIATERLGLIFDVRSALAVVALQAVVAILTVWRLARSDAPVGTGEVIGHVGLEIVLSAAVLFFSGGTANPFAPLLLLPLVAAASLPTRWIWLTALATVAAYVALRNYGLPLTHTLGPMEVFRIHANGDQISYLISATVVAYFIAYMVRTVRHYERMLADVQERQIREDSVVAIGALAAGCAHSLSTPLSTMRMLVDELRTQPIGASSRGNLDDLGQQLTIAQGIVLQLTGAARRHVEEQRHPVGIDRFVDDIVARARTLHPTVTIVGDIADRAGARPIVPDEGFRQAIHVLIDNAAQSARHEVRIEMQVVDGEIGVTVSDDGPGFPEDKLTQLGRARFSTKVAGAGSGLGLVLASVTAHRLGGMLRLGNRAGGGAWSQLVVPLSSFGPVCETS